MPERNGNSPGGAGSATEEGRALGNEVGQIASELRELLGMEADLAKAEVNEATGKLIRGIAFGVGAFLMADMTAIFLFLTLMFALDTAMPLWAAALVTTLILGLIAAVLGLFAMRHLRGLSFMPKRFVRSVKEDWTWARNLMSLKTR